MSAFIQQLPALLGVLIGALGSYVVVMRGDDARFRREQAARREDRRLAAYAEFARSLRASVSTMFRAAAQLGNDPHPHPLPVEEAAVRLGEASEARDLAWESVLLLGSPAVVDAAREWAAAVAEMERAVRAERHDPEGWTTLVAKQRIGRERFYATARRDVALPAGHSGRWQTRPRPEHDAA
ncbi:hypothetical protein DY218_00055 [Streptomyces triticagri]|uniref:Secreted protein n=1 Tax=Streptomyces triticagri TaxID=2293568 RepID=A0A372MCS6_9ACTN|nr:hypothetical protein [Streptomyces triticagri]RFU88742.1 hypothetical protein DY218_00055 [Streptomyces triticagri]